MACAKLRVGVSAFPLFYWHNQGEQRHLGRVLVRGNRGMGAAHQAAVDDSRKEVEELCRLKTIGLGAPLWEARSAPGLPIQGDQTDQTPWRVEPRFVGLLGKPGAFQSGSLSFNPTIKPR